jgi:hypothetical protein
MYERPRLALGIGQLSRFGGLLPVDRTVAKMKEVHVLRAGRPPRPELFDSVRQ